MTKRKFIFSELFNIGNWSVYLMSISVVVFISFLFPSSVSFDYEYSKGSMWRNEDLTADFDFPILKDKTIYNAQLDDVSSQVEDVYIKDDIATITNSKRVISQLLQEMSALPNLSRIDTIGLSNELMSIFQQGVVDEKKDLMIRLVVGDKSSRIDLNGLYVKQEVLDAIKIYLQKDSITLNQSTFNSINNVVFPNVSFDADLTDKFKQEAINKIPTSNGVVAKEEVIVKKGDILSDNDINLIDSYKVAYELKVMDDQSKRVIFGGYLLLTCLIILALLMFIFFNYRDVFNNWRKLLFFMIWPVVMSYMVYTIEQTVDISTYLIPFCIVPLLIQTFFDERLAFFVHVVNVLIASFLSSLGYEFAFVQILAGIVIIQASTETRYWNNFFSLILILLVTYLLSYLGLEMIKEGSIVDIEGRVFMWLALSTLLTLLAYPFVPLMERLFGFTSDITMVELSDFNRPLLKKLSIEAPGTFQHSIQVANLSEAATDKIGGNALLVKVAALYHDIGKMVNPEAFIENQGSHDNPHDNWSSFESAKVIISHVTEGEIMARKAGLPDVIIDFIKTHHGTTRVEYFYRNQLTSEPDREFDESLFRYHGPNPWTKEQTILMLADSVEAASKSLKSPTGEDIDKLVDKIVKFKTDHNQLEESNLTFGELRSVSDTFKTLLRNIYHVRVEYPEEPDKVSTGNKSNN